MSRLNVSSWDTGLLSSLKASENLDPKASEEALRYANKFGISASRAMQEVDSIKSTWGKGDDNGLIELPKTSPQVAELLKDPIMASIYRNAPDMALRWAKDTESEYGLFKSVLNGMTGFMGATTGAVGGGLEVLGHVLDNERIYNAGQRAVANANEWFGMRYNVQAETTAGRIGYAFVENAPQFLAQVFVGMFSPVAAAALMAGQIGGAQYAELRRNNINIADSALASGGNALGQGLLESISLGKILNVGRRISKGTNAGRAIAEAMATEGITEFIQEYPDAAAEIWARYNHFSTEDQVNRFIADFEEITENGMYAGAVGGLYGLIGGSVSAAAGRQIQKQKTAFVDHMAERARTSGVTPDVAKATIDGLADGEVVYLDAETVKRVFNQQGIDPALTLGITESQIEQAVESGSDIVVSAGTLAKARMEIPTLFEEMKGNFAFGNGEAMESRVKEKRTMEAAIYKAQQQERQSDAVFGEFRNQLEAAGYKGREINDIITILRSRGASYNPENPGQYYIDHPLEFARGGDGGVYAQAAMKKSEAKSLSNFYNEITTSNIDSQGKSKLFYPMTTSRGARIDVANDNILHFAKKHKLDTTLLDTIEGNIESIEDAYVDNKKRGSNGGKQVLAKIKTPAGNAGVLFEFLSNGRIFMTTAFFDSDANIENWMKKEGARTSKLEISNPSTFTGPPSIINIIKEKLGIVKDSNDETKGYNQSAFHGSPYKFNEFDLGAIGTGTGVQAHGWGLYFAFSKNTAKRYRDRLKGSTDEGSLFEVDIPENDVLLDEGKAIEKQPPKVRAIIETELERIGGSASNGKSFYKEIIFEMQRMGAENPARAASEHLNKLGIKGIKYVGMVDGESYVIFDDQAIKIINSYNQKVNNDKKGSIHWDAEGKAIINLFKGADMSTVIHEAVGHYFNQNLMSDGVLGTATEQMRKDRQTMLDYAELTEQEWNELNRPNEELTDEQFARKEAAHERWAEAAETYFMEGKAPTEELRGVMSRFKKWLLDLYGSIMGERRNQNAVEITDDVRQVFDRMLASEKMIAEEARINGYFAPFPENIRNGISKAQLKSLAALESEAKGLAVEKLSKEMTANFTQERREKIAARENELQKAAEEQVAAERVYIASELIKDDMGHNAKYLSKHYIEGTLSDEQVASFELIAGLSEYTNGLEMANDILAAPTYNTAVKDAIQTAIKQEFPDLAAERAAARQAAKESLYNSSSALLVATEAEIISGHVDKIVAAKYAKARAETAKIQAQTDMRERFKINEATKTTKFITAERNAAIKGYKALTEGDTATAARYKNIQLYNHYCVQESIKIREEQGNLKRYIKKISRSDIKSWKNEKHLAQAGALLSRFGVKLKGYDPEVRTQSLSEYMTEMNDLYDNVDIALWLVSEDVQIANPGKELTIIQLQDLVDAVKNIKHIAADENSLKVLGEKGSFLETKAQLLEHLGTLPTKSTNEIGAEKNISMKDRLLASIQTPETLLEKYDGWKRGLLSKLFGKPARQRDDVLNVMKAEWINSIKDAREAWLPSKKDKVAAYEKKLRKELGGEPISDMELVQILCNLGNAEGIEKMCAVGSRERPTLQSMRFKDSELWIEGDKDATLKNILNFIGREIGAGGIRYAQAKIDAAGKRKNEKFDLDRRYVGFAPTEVKPVSSAIETPEGVVMFRGGYFPLVRDKSAGSRPQGQDAISDTPNIGGKIRTNRGSSKNRTKAVYPIDISVDAEMKAVMDSLHDIAYRELFNDVNKLFNDGEIYSALVEKLGVADFTALREYFLAKTNNTKSANIGENLMSDTASWLRRKTSNFVIMFNVKVNIQNLGNIFLYGNDVDGWTHTDTIAALSNWGANLQEAGKFSGLVDGVNELSPYMKYRSENPDYTIAELRAEGKMSGIEEKFVDAGAKIMALTDGLTAYPVWIGAYAKAKRNGAGHLDARDFADTVIRRTLGSFDSSNVAPIMRAGGAWKLVTMFQSFFITQANQWIREYGIFMKEKDVMRLANFALSKWLVFCMMNLLFAGEDPFEEDEGLGTKLYNELATYPVSMWGPVGTVGNIFLSNALGIKNYGYRLSAAQSTIEKTVAAPGKIKKAFEGKRSVEEATEDVTYLMALFGGVPKGIHTLFWNSYDYIENDMDLKLGDIYRRRPKKERDE